MVDRFIDVSQHEKKYFVRVGSIDFVTSNAKGQATIYAGQHVIETTEDFKHVLHILGRVDLDKFNMELDETIETM